MAYASDETGESEVYVQPLSGPQGKWQISTGGGYQPRWSHDGRRLYFMSAGAGEMMTVEVAPAPGGGLTVGQPRALFSLQGYHFLTLGRSYDVAADGRFLLLKEGAASAAQQHVIVHWSQLLPAK